MATNGYLTWMSPRGFRLELYIITILMFSYYVFISSSKISLQARMIGLCVWSVLTVWLRINSVIFIIPLLVYSAWKHEIGWKYVLWPIVMMLIFLLPHFVYNQKNFGDPFFSSNIHAVYYRNYEFVKVKEKGCVGCPTRDEFSASSYSGSPTTTFKYVFGMHGIGEIAGNTWKGFKEILLEQSQFFQNQTGKTSSTCYYIYLAGLIFILFSRYRIMLLMPILLINFLAFIVPIHLDPRLSDHIAPFISFGLAFGIWIPLILINKGYLLLSAREK